MRLYLIRHGDPDYSTDRLTPKGKLEAAALAEYLATRGITQLHSSPLGRALETAQFVARKLGLAPVIQDWTRELKGARLPGSDFVHWDIHGHEVRQPAYLANPSDWRQVPLLADPVRADYLAAQMAEVAQNSDRFLAGLGYVREGGVYRVSQSHREAVAVVCHGGFGLTWLAHLLAIPAPLMWTGFFLHTSSVTTILFDERQPGLAVPRCIGLSELTHLHLQGLPPGSSGIKANYE